MVISSFQNRDPLLGEPWYFKSLKDRKTGDKLLRKVGNVNFKHHYMSKQQSYLYFLFFILCEGDKISVKSTFHPINFLSSVNFYRVKS